MFQYVYVTGNVSGGRGLKPAAASVAVDASSDEEGVPLWVRGNKRCWEDKTQCHCQQQKQTATTSRHGCSQKKTLLTSK